MSNIRTCTLASFEVASVVKVGLLLDACSTAGGRSLVWSRLIFSNILCFLNQDNWDVRVNDGHFTGIT